MEEQKKQSGLGIASLILGIIGILTACIVIGIIPCVVGLILALIAFTEKNKKSGFAVAGLICSLVGIIIFVVIMIAAINSKEAESDDTNYSVEVIVQEPNEESVSETSSVISGSEESVQDKATQESIEESVSESAQETTVTPTKSAEEIEQEYKDSCKEYKYKDVLRNPENYVGEKVKITVKINTVVEESWMNDCKYYFAYSNDEYDLWFGDEYVIFDRREEQNPKLLEDDVITVYGEITDPEHTTSLILSGSELFAIDMKYIDFISE